MKVALAPSMKRRRSWRLRTQIDVGLDVSESETRQATLLTAVNTAVRAFLGGVRVRLREHGRMTVAWAEGMDMATAVETYGGTIVESLDRNHPTLVIGDVKEQPLAASFCTQPGRDGRAASSRKQGIGWRN